MIFRDRLAAGQQLAQALQPYHAQHKTIILALPRGGVPVAAEVAKVLRLPLDIFLVRKLGVPGQEELAMGAIAMGGIEILNHEIVREFAISHEQIDQAKQEQLKILQERNQLYRGNRPFPSLKHQTVILIDDGVATGATMRAAITAIKNLYSKKIIVAVPVAPVDTYHELKQIVDEVVCLATPEPFFAIGNWYQAFPQTTDQEVKEALALSTPPHQS